MGRVAGLLSAACLAVWFAQAMQGQISLSQQMPNYSTAPASPAASSRNKAGISVDPGSPVLRMIPEDFVSLKIGPGFLLSLNVLDDPDFAGLYRVDETGNIIVPVLGRIRVGGETAGAAADQIKDDLLKRQILNDPQVTLNIIEYVASEVNILGEVTSPGKYPFLAPHRLIDVLALAGGTTLLSGDEIDISNPTRPNDATSVHYGRGSDPKTIENVIVNPGDTVRVQRAGIVYVLGAVTRPGGYVMQENGTLTIMEAIALANGTTPFASTKQIYMMHKNEDGTSVWTSLRFKGMTQGKYADIKLRATDVVFVPTSTMKSVLINSQSVLASTAGAAIYAGVIR